MQKHLVLKETEPCFIYAACPRAVFARVAGVDKGGAFEHDVTFGQWLAGRS